MRQIYIGIGFGFFLFTILLLIFPKNNNFIFAGISFIFGLLMMFLGNLRTKVDCTNCKFCRYECSHKIIKNE